MSFDYINKSNYNSPVYSIKSIPVWDIVAQPFNPNSLNSKTFSALQRSIFNSGFTMCVTTCTNKYYDENERNKFSGIDRIKMCIIGSENDNKSGYLSTDMEYATQLSDINMRKAFKIELIDGTQRTGVIRMGTYLFLSLSKEKQIEKSNEWSNGEKIPNKPGKNMLMYLAWRENFCMPCCVLEEKSDVNKMSATILLNSARGSHNIESLKDIVAKLKNEAGMSEEWISDELFLDISSVKRMVQLSGLKQAYSDMTSSSLAWNPYTDDSYKKKQTLYLNRAAANYIKNYMKEHGNKVDFERTGGIIEYAKTLGFNENDVE